MTARRAYQVFARLVESCGTNNAFLPFGLINVVRYVSMIKSVRDRDTDRLFQRQPVRKVGTRPGRIRTRWGTLRQLSEPGRMIEGCLTHSALAAARAKKF